MIPVNIASLRQISPDEVTIELALPEEHPAFDGHFPGHPVLPGVVQIDWALTLAQTHLGTARRVGRDFQVKFNHIIPSGGTITLSLKCDRDKQVLHFRYADDGTTVSSGRIGLGVTP